MEKYLDMSFRVVLELARANITDDPEMQWRAALQREQCDLVERFAIKHGYLVEV